MSIIKKTDCVKIIKPNEIYTVHPLINLLTVINYKPTTNPETTESCHILPQLSDNEIIFIKKKQQLQDTGKINIGIADNTENDMHDNDKILKDETILNFELPINSNNFLEIVFNINSVSQLIEWIINFDVTNEKVVKLVLNLFWVTKQDKINEEYEMFIKLNQKIIKLMFDKDIDNELMTKIIDKMLKENYGKKIKYLDKIKKYLIKYI